MFVPLLFKPSQNQSFLKVVFQPLNNISVWIYVLIMIVMWGRLSRPQPMNACRLEVIRQQSDYTEHLIDFLFQRSLTHFFTHLRGGFFSRSPINNPAASRLQVGRKPGDTYHVELKAVVLLHQTQHKHAEPCNNTAQNIFKINNQGWNVWEKREINEVRNRVIFGQTRLSLAWTFQTS